MKNKYFYILIISLLVISTIVEAQHIFVSSIQGATNRICSVRFNGRVSYSVAGPWTNVDRSLMATGAITRTLYILSPSLGWSNSQPQSLLLNGNLAYGLEGGSVSVKDSNGPSTLSWEATAQELPFTFDSADLVEAMPQSVLGDNLFYLTNALFGKSTGTNTQRIWLTNNPATTNYVRNPNLWLTNDLSGWAANKQCTLINRRQVIGVKHDLTTGVVHFVSANNVVWITTLTNIGYYTNNANVDMAAGILADEAPSYITSYEIAPTNYLQYFSTLGDATSTGPLAFSYPVCFAGTANSTRQASLRYFNLTYANTKNQALTNLFPWVFTGDVPSGTSGTPVFWQVGGKLLFIYAISYSNGDGYWLMNENFPYWQEILQRMATNEAPIQTDWSSYLRR